jgi:hypothetical protein
MLRADMADCLGESLRGASGMSGCGNGSEVPRGGNHHVSEEHGTK